VKPTEHSNGSARLCWVGPFRLDQYLASVVSRQKLRPPDAAGVYILSEHTWEGIPDARANLIYAAQAPYLRYRIGQLLCDLLGFTGEDPADSDAYEHSGGHLLWHRYCIARGVEPVSLHIAWCSPCKCIDCAENRLLELTQFGPSSAMRRSCAKHDPALDLAYNCSRSVAFPAVSARLLNTGKN
jgi:hypothetical protein